jgi:hypothetical protein
VGIDDGIAEDNADDDRLSQISEAVKSWPATVEPQSFSHPNVSTPPAVLDGRGISRCSSRSFDDPGGPVQTPWVPPASTTGWQYKIDEARMSAPGTMIGEPPAAGYAAQDRARMAEAAKAKAK